MGSLFVTCLPGLETVLAKEVEALGFATRPWKGGVFVDGATLRDAMVLNLHLRTASRVLWHLFDISNPTKSRLYKAISDVDWRVWFTDFPTLAIDVPFAQHPDYSNSLYVAQLAKDAICDQLRAATGKRPSVDVKNPQIQFSIIVDPRKASLSFDTSLQPLFKRGYREDGGIAPLKETLAAALLSLAGYEAHQGHILFDPCCGTGTILIEAALMATKTPPGLLRTSFGFVRHPEFQEEEWRQVRAEGIARVQPSPGRIIFGCEQDPKTYHLLLRAIAKAGMMDVIETWQKDFRDCHLKKAPNFVITNPPFGVRMGEMRRWIPLYSAIGHFMKRYTQKPSVGAVLSSSPELIKAIGLAPKQKIKLSHGGLEALFCVYDIYG